MMDRTMKAALAVMLVGTLAVPAAAMAADLPTTAVNDEPMVIAAQEDTHRSLSSFTLKVDGKETAIDACVMVPVRAVAEQLGFTVTWSKDGTVRLDDGVMHADLTIGKDLYQVVTSKTDLVGMSAPFSLGAAPYLSNGTTYVPLGLFEALKGNVDGMFSLDGSTIVVNTKSGDQSDNGAQIPDPFVDCQDLAAAAEQAGFSFSVPGSIQGYTKSTIQAIPGDMIQVFYDGKDGSELLLRKAVGTDDVSGDYNVYAQTRTVTVDGVSVTMKGNDGTVSVATWVRDGHSFAVDADQGISVAQMTGIVTATR